MGHVTVVGAQWGDEGKGKIVDWLSERADIVVRFQGGHNAGHTLQVGGETYRLSLLPAGVVRGKLSMIGSGVVIDPWALLAEIDRIRGQGVAIGPDVLRVADNAALILPVHQALDRALEQARAAGRLGTTGRGIGPAYEDKAARRAIRICDLADPATLRERLQRLAIHHNALLAGLGAPPADHRAMYDSLLRLAPDLAPYVDRVWQRLAAAGRAGRRILFEGAQGAMLDVDHGTWPFVTSTTTMAGQAATGAGVGPAAAGYVLGITKAYTTRVGTGPFPTEQRNDTGEEMGRRGHEFGTVTSRKRRCGWFDATMVRQALTIGGVNGIALTKLDVLDGFPELRIAVGYRVGGERLDYFPAGIAAQANAEPVYETLPGWSETTRGARSWDDLPDNAIRYVRRIEALIEAPVAMLSTSPERQDTILVHDPFQRPGPVSGLT